MLFKAFKNKKNIKHLLLGLALVAGFVAYGLNAGTVRAADSSDIERAYKSEGHVLESKTYVLNHDIKSSGLIVVKKNIEATIDLNGYTIDRRLTKCIDKGSVIRVENGGKLTIKDSSGDNSGLITGGASFNGGGICNHGTLIIEGGTIAKNKSFHDTYGGGGGIFNGRYGGDEPGNLVIKGGVIKENLSRFGAGIANDQYSNMTIIAGVIAYNKADTNGGGLVSYGQCQLEGGVFQNNKAVGYGGGIYFSTEKGKVAQKNTVVVEKNQAEKGGGVYIEKENIKMQDCPQITNNKGGDLYLAKGVKIEIPALFSEDAKVGIDAEDTSATFTHEWGTYYEIIEREGISLFTGAPNVMLEKRTRNTISVASVFYSNNCEFKVSPDYAGDGFFASMLTDFKKFLKITEEKYSGTRLYLASSTYFLQEDVTIDSELVVDNDVNVVIDLNGHKIKNVNSNEDAESLFTVLKDGTLTIKDSTKKGAITGGRARLSGGAIYNKGKVDVDGVNFYDNQACGINSSQGGAVYNIGTMTLTNCTFKNNKAKYSGGSVSNAKDMVLSKCTISDSEAITGYGGGLFQAGVSANTTFKNSVVVTGNKSGKNGAGIMFSLNKLNISGTVRVEKNEGDNLYIGRNAAITIDGELSKMSHIGITSERGGRTEITKNLSNSKYAYDNPDKVFVPDDSKFHTVITPFDEVCLNDTKEKFVAVVKEDDVTKYCISLEEAMQGYENYYYDDIEVILLDDVKVDRRCSGTDQKILLDLNGHAIYGNGQKNEYSKDDLINGSFLLVTKGQNLTIKDSKPENKNSLGEGGIIAYSYNSAIVVADGANVNVKGIKFLNNTTFAKGGAIRVGKNSTVELSECTFDGNKAVYDKIVFNDDQLNSSVNDTKNSGSSFYTDGSDIGVGGAVAAQNASVVFDKCIFKNNHATKKGGTFYGSGPSPKSSEDTYDSFFRECTIENEEAGESGGSIYLVNTKTDMMLTNLEKNKAEKGGALYMEKAKAYFSDVKVKNNTATSNGGGVFVDPTSSLGVQDFVYIDENKVDSEANNVYLNDDSNNHPYINSGGVVEGSKIGISRKDINKSGIKTILNVSTPEIRKGIYKADKGKLVSKRTKQKDFLLSATVIGSFDKALFLLIGLELVGAAYLIIVAYRKKRG